MSKGEFPVSTLFGRTLKFLTDEMEHRLSAAKLDVTIVEFVLLYRLSTIDEDDVSQQNFANLEGKHKSVILRQIEGLEGKKLLARIPDQKDRRKNNIVLTQKGSELLDKLLALEKKMMQELTKGLSGGEIDVLKKVSLQIQHNALRLKRK
jgi:DNA-binding MarR family transcriptional regulator